MMRKAGHAKEERVKGLFTSGLAWLARMLAPGLIDKAKEKIMDWADKHKGLPPDYDFN